MKTCLNCLFFNGKMVVNIDEEPCWSCLKDIEHYLPKWDGTKEGEEVPVEYTSIKVEIPLHVENILRIVQGRLEGFAAGYSYDDHQYAFLMDTAEMIMNLLDGENEDA